MKISVIGAGAWGTALAIHFARTHEVTLLAHQAAHAEAMNQARMNERYLNGYVFPSGLTVGMIAVQQPELVIIATPVAGLRSALTQMLAWGWGKAPVLLACKGFEQGSGLLVQDVAAEGLPENDCIGLLSGPSFAQELAQGLPCAVSLSSSNHAWIDDLTAKLNSQIMRLYANHDPIGVAVGGAVKNVMAIATGIADGLDYGMNARAALITRGLAEINRLARSLGAEETTLMGLAGMGDLILTCTGSLSRNRNVGLKLAEGKSLPVILDELGHVAEGVYTVREAGAKAQALGIDMPITLILNQLFDGKIDVQSVAEALMGRVARSEED